MLKTILMEYTIVEIYENFTPNNFEFQKVLLLLIIDVNETMSYNLDTLQSLFSSRPDNNVFS
jgi:hypothetical protein